MPDHDRLSSLILEHWTRYHPSMLVQLQMERRLAQELERTAEMFAEMMYQLVSVQGMEYSQAWELAIQEFLLPAESSSTNPTKSPPETSESPTPILSGWEARMRKRARTSKPSGS